MLKRGQAALEDFATAIKLCPHSAHIYFNRANLFMSLDMLSEAECDYTTGACSLINCLSVLKQKFLFLLPFAT